jgi:hypothetical protein
VWSYTRHEHAPIRRKLYMRREKVQIIICIARVANNNRVQTSNHDHPKIIILGVDTFTCKARRLSIPGHLNLHFSPSKASRQFGDCSVHVSSNYQSR